MKITISLKDIEELRRLGNRLDAGIIETGAIRSFLAGIERKLNVSAPVRKRFKKNRTDNYRDKIRKVA